MKRARDVDDQDPLVQSFSAFVVELRESQDVREQLVKVSRDVTVSSKRAIFALHRSARRSAGAGDTTEGARKALSSITGSLFPQISSRVDPSTFWKYQRAFSPGVQEFVEALSLLEWFETGGLLTYEKAREATCGVLCEGDYLLGVADLSGELMRVAINAASRADVALCREVSGFLRKLVDGLAGLEEKSGAKDIGQKMEVARQSLTKVDDALYKLTIRKAEFPDADMQGIQISEENPATRE